MMPQAGKLDVLNFW